MPVPPGHSQHTPERATPTWVDVAGRPLAVHVHRPSTTRVRGSLVIAPAVGKEAVITHRAILALARRAAASGFITFRFDWAGQGESAPTRVGEELVDAWCADLGAVLDLARTIVPGTQPSLVGVRLGAGIAAVFDRADLAERYLWEPVSGPAHLRYHAALRRVSVPVPIVEEGIELEGCWFDPAELDSLRTLQCPTDGPEVINEPDEAALTSFVQVESALAAIPRRTIAQLVDLLPRGNFATADWTPVDTARIGDAIEQFVTVGPDALPGVLTTPAEAPVHTAVAFAPCGNEPRTGPAHLWVTAGRDLARHGVATLRTDRRGQGELADTSSDHAPNPYNAHGIPDAVATIDELRARFPSVTPVAVGLGAGAWTSTLAAERTQVSTVMAINNIAWKRDPRAYGRFDPPSATGTTVRSLMCDRAMRPLVRLRAHLHGTRLRNRALAGLERGKALLTSRTPVAGWAALARTSPLEYPGTLVPRPTGTTYRFHMGVTDSAYFDRIKGRAAFAALRSRGVDISCFDWPDLDHALLAERSRRRALSILRAITTECWANGPGLAA